MIVRELIDRLNEADPELPVVIDDADTSMTLNIKHVDVEGEHVCIGGYYDDEWVPFADSDAGQENVAALRAAATEKDN